MASGCAELQSPRFEVGAVCQPWENAPIGVVSLIDLLRLYGTAFAISYGNLERAEVSIGFYSLGVEAHEPLSEENFQHIRGAIGDFEQQCKEILVSHSLRLQIERLLKRLDAERLGNDTLRHLAIALIQEIKNNFIAEIACNYYLLIPTERRPLFEQRKPLFGQEVHAKFGAAARDIADAGRCIALEQWTAAVFHLMRVAEHGLHDLAQRLNVTFASPIELENWKNIIDAIDKEIRKLEQKPKGLQKSEDLKFYSGAASQLWFFKEKWRNHVSHSRATYDEREALDAFNAVSSFMKALTARS